MQSTLVQMQLTGNHGAVHKKKDKNTKVNRAKEKRFARKAEKLKSKKRGKK